ncbi:MAG: coproporphyrinogen III oxidase family protein [Deltaproteobacteria bacterium]|nr:coproporphyrinogen III oxidase family protein [Deltaproteobacteria bacterium]
MLGDFIVTHVARRKIPKLLKFEYPKGSVFHKEKKRTPILMYIHVPFCEELCPYCSFHRFPFDKDLAKRYFYALRKEIFLYRDLGFKFDGVYVGGGTPTILIDELIETLNLTKKNFQIREISVETNPNHLNEKNLKLLLEVGVKRLSIGVQSFDDAILKSVERYHKYGSGEEIKEKIMAINGMFHTVNIDMIFNFPHQTVKSIENDLNIIRTIGVNQVTFYPLMISSYTRSKLEKKLGRVDFKRERKFYEIILRELEKDFFPATAWCFSKDEGMIDEYVVNYDEYAGLGCGSIGYVDGYAYANTFNISQYILKVEDGEIPISGIRHYKLRERVRYDFLMKLFGLKLDLDELDRKYGISSRKFLFLEIMLFTALGALRIKGSKLSLTRNGLYYWVIMMREFFTAVNNFRDFLRGF